MIITLPCVQNWIGVKPFKPLGLYRLPVNDTVMLHSLHIENFAIVERQEVTFSHGLTTLTGETGAGKSILIDALGMVLGERADSSIVRQGCENAQIAAQFSLDPSATEWLQQHDLASEEEADDCLIRRVINEKGRSRCYVNDRPVSLQILKQLGEQLVDIHGQHAHQSLLKLEVQRQLLDAMADDPTPLQNVAASYRQWRDSSQALAALGGESSDREARLALLRYQVQELEGFELTETALQQLEDEHKLLANANRLVENTQAALHCLDSEDGTAALDLLNQASRELSEVQAFDERLSDLSGQLDGLVIQAQDIVSELRHYLHHLDIDPVRLQQVEQTISDLQDLARKHRVTVADLPRYFNELVQQLSELENYEQRAAHLEQEVQRSLAQYHEAAAVLHRQRTQQAKTLATQITDNMRPLGMSGGQIVIEVTPLMQAAPSASGQDKVEFLVSANPGQSPKPLHKVASGGELSRISLAIQVITAQRSGVPTLIFDEVDVGIGGGVAEIVGKLLRQLGEQRQVLCITHLPQVACQGEQHLQVSKTIGKNHTQTQIMLLDEQQRVTEIARMLGGVEITAQTLAHAAEMLQWRVAS